MDSLYLVLIEFLISRGTFNACHNNNDDDDDDGDDDECGFFNLS